MDRLPALSTHKGERVRELVRCAGCELLYLPPYSSPEFSPIKEAFSKVRGLLCKVGTRSRQALVEALSNALDVVTARDARGFCEQCGYLASDQLILIAAVGVSVLCKRIFTEPLASVDIRHR